MCDAIARLPGCSGECSDAAGAYTQATLGGPETWVSLPKAWWPPSWFYPDGTPKYNDPVCRLVKALYGHPLAGLYWEKHVQKHLIDLGFVQVPSWECLYVHQKKQLFLSIYVDDFCMAGKRENIDKMWKLLGKHIVLDPPTPMNGGTYLGCSPYDIEAPMDAVKRTREAYLELTSSAKHLKYNAQQMTHS